MTRPNADTLIFACGNPSRGDDALGPRLVERLEARQRAGALPAVTLLTDFQLQIEHALDLAGHSRVIFVDASISAPEPFACSPVAPEQDASYTTHAMSPGAVLKVFEQINSRQPPPCYLLAIRGYDFDLGSPLTAAAKHNLDEAERFLLLEIAGYREEDTGRRARKR
jgi:hydrogenase maturation protease